MNILITGACGYVGSKLSLNFVERGTGHRIFGIDNLSRRGSETNLPILKSRGVVLRHGDVRLASDFEELPAVDWVVDCAANPSVLAGITNTNACTPRQLVEHNLTGTINVLEFCRKNSAGLVLLSTSRIYSIEALRQIPLKESADRFVLDLPNNSVIGGCSEFGISEEFPTTAPLSLYGATKLASEVLALEYGADFSLPIRINRCGVIGGPGQFGRIDQGVFSYWVYSHALGKPLSYIGFGGTGKQVRDCVLAEDVAELVWRQMADPWRNVPKILNVGGGNDGALSLLEITRLCESFFSNRLKITACPEGRPMDIPYFVTDTRLAEKAWGWQSSHTGEEIVRQLCQWTSTHLEQVWRQME